MNHTKKFSFYLSIGEFALDKKVFNQVEVGPLIEIILPAAPDEICQTFVGFLGDHWPHLLTKLLFYGSLVHVGKWYLTGLKLIEDHSERVHIDCGFIVETLPLVRASHDFLGCPSRQVLVLREQFSKLLERLKVIVSHIDVHI